MEEGRFADLLSLRKHQILYDGEYLTKEEKNDVGMSVDVLLSMTDEQLNELEMSCLRWKVSIIEDKLEDIERKMKALI